MSAQQAQIRGIVRLQAENTKRLKAVEIEPDGNIVVIGGNNGQGKSSLLDTIEWALGGKRCIPDKPIREGCEDAYVILETADLIVTRTFTKKGSYLKVKNRDGATFSNAQEVLDRLVGNLSFDPLAFTKLDAKKQAEALRDLVGIDTSELDILRRQAFETRTQVNRDVKRLESARDRSTHYEGVGEEEQSAKEILASIESANEGNQRIRNLDGEITLRTKNIDLIDEEIGRLTKRREEEEQARTKAKEARVGLSFVNTEQLKASLDEIEEHNRKVRENIDHAKITKQLDEATQQADELTEQIEGIDAEKAQLIREANFPIEGLGFNDDNIVTFNGIPFSQSSSAEQIRVSVAIGLAMNPELRVLLIRDGSLLDTKSLELIRDMAEENEAMIFIERVGEGEECSVIIEDGMVKGGAS